MTRILLSSSSSRGSLSSGSHVGCAASIRKPFHSSFMMFTMISCCSKFACTSKLTIIGRFVLRNAASRTALQTSLNPTGVVNVQPWRTIGSPFLVDFVDGGGSLVSVTAIDSDDTSLTLNILMPKPSFFNASFVCLYFASNFSAVSATRLGSVVPER